MRLLSKNLNYIPKLLIINIDGNNLHYVINEIVNEIKKMNNKIKIIC